MVDFGNAAGITALVGGGLAVISPSVLGGHRFGGDVGGFGGYGGMMGGYGRPMGGYGGMMGGYGGSMGGYGGFGTGPSLFGTISQLGIILVLIGGGYLLYRAVRSRDGTGASGVGDPALNELRRAYARGDISDEEFERRRATLRVGGDR